MRWLGGFGQVLLCVVTAGWVLQARAAAATGVMVAQPEFGANPLAPAAAAFAADVQRSVDHGGLPFAVVDKAAARMAVYAGNGQLMGVTRVLLGRTAGDGSLPGVGERAQRRQLLPEDRTTPAGRFLAVPGRNHTGEPVVWLDEEAALALHRLRPGPQAAARAQSLRSPDARNKRQTDGCVVVPVAFYDSVVQRVLGAGSSIIYILPEVAAAH